MLKIINISTSNIGGAGNAVERINNVLNQFSNSFIIALTGKKKAKTIIIPNYNLYFFLIKVKRYIIHFHHKYFSKKHNKKYNYYNYDENKNYVDANKLLLFLPFNPDIIVVHYTSHFINFKTIYEMQKLTGAFILFNMLDTSFLTGGCHYSWDCEGYTKCCEKCPALTNKSKANQSFRNFKEKQKYLKHINYAINVSSSWALRQVEKSNLFNTKKTSLIFYPIDENIYKPKKINSFKGISNYDKKIILIGSQDLNDERKGWEYLINSLDHTYKSLSESKRSEVIILIAGAKINNFQCKFSYYFCGHLNTNELIDAYNFSDVFLCSSVEDNGPMMVNESLMCGTPVVSFSIGISGDLIKENNGFIAENKNSIELSKGILKILFSNKKDIYARSSREIAIKNYNNKKIKNEWKKLICNQIKT